MPTRTERITQHVLATGRPAVVQTNTAGLRQWSVLLPGAPGSPSVLAYPFGSTDDGRQIALRAADNYAVDRAAGRRAARRPGLAARYPWRLAHDPEEA